MVVSAVESERIVVTVVDMVIGELEGHRRCVLVVHADRVVLRVIKNVLIIVSLSVLEECAPLIVPLLSRADHPKLRCAVSTDRPVVGD